MTWTETSTPDGPMRLYQADAGGNTRGAVIVIQEAFGVNDHIMEVADRLAAEGWRAFAPALFHRAGPDPVAPYDDFSKVMPLFQGLDDDGVLRDLDATLDVVHQQGIDNPAIGMVGFCWGGRVTLFGDEDQSIPVEDVERLRDALTTSAKVDFDVIRYPRAGHGFHCDARPDSYVEGAASDGWARALAWFDAHLKTA